MRLREFIRIHQQVKNGSDITQLIEWVRSTEGFWGALTCDNRTGQYAQLLMRLREFIRIHQQVKNGPNSFALGKHHATCNPIPASRAVLQ